MHNNKKNYNDIYNYDDTSQIELIPLPYDIDEKLTIYNTDIQSILKETITLYELHTNLNQIIEKQEYQLDLIDDLLHTSQNNIIIANIDIDTSYENSYKYNIKTIIIGAGIMGTSILLVPLYPQVLTWGILGGSFTIMASFFG